MWVAKEGGKQGCVGGLQGGGAGVASAGAGVGERLEKKASARDTAVLLDSFGVRNVLSP